MTRRCRTFLVALAVGLALAGCMTRPPAPVDERAPFPAFRPPPAPPPAPPPRDAETRVQTYVVKRGETLAQIALDHGVDYRELAAWNNIENPNVIRVGQVLVLSPAAQGAGGGASASPGVTTAPLVTAPPIGGPGEGRPSRPNTASYKSEPKALKLPYSEQALAQLSAAPPPPPHSPAVPPPGVPTPAPAVVPPVVATPPASVGAAPPKSDSARAPEIDSDKIDWTWPTSGKVIAGFSENANLKGIDIGGKAGQPVLASAAGRVVYAGSGLRGYGKLIIVKHNNTFLSAYAHNREILVKEGQHVSKGQKIAEMGDTDADQVKLHFEIRRLGKPIDPSKYLPPA
jgi:lipoprotein NlpD